MSSPSRGAPHSTQPSAQPPTDNLVSVFAETMRLAGVTGAADSAAGAAVGRLTTADLEEIRTLRNPPAVVRRTLEATFLLLNAHKPCSHSPPSWQRVQRMLADASFLSRMQEYDADSLRAAPDLAAFIAKEYFGSGGSSSETRSVSKRASMNSSQLSRGGGGGTSPGSRSSVPVLRRHATWSVHDHKAADQEPLSFRRVRYASLAAASLFAWCTASLVDGLDLDVKDVMPSIEGLSPALPSITPGADGASCARGGSPETESKDNPAVSSVGHVETLPALNSPPASPGVHIQSLPALNEGSCSASASTAPKATVASPVASRIPTPVVPTITQASPITKSVSKLPFQTQVNATQEKKVEPVKKARTKPDRHFELVCSFDMGYSDWTESGEIALQTVAATMCMRKNLCLMLLGAPAEIESDALDKARIRIVQEFFGQNGLMAAKSPDPTRIMRDGSDPGVVCQVTLEKDRELRDYFLLREEGEKLRLSAATKCVVDMLEQDFKTVRDDE